MYTLFLRQRSPYESRARETIKELNQCIRVSQKAKKATGYACTVIRDGIVIALSVMHTLWIYGLLDQKGASFKRDPFNPPINSIHSAVELKQ